MEQKTGLIIPPLKCQGIKTKLVPSLRSIAPRNVKGRWIEPFCGSGVVAFNVGPQRALLTDTNKHVIEFYQDIQSKKIAPDAVRVYLEKNGALLAARGESHYYAIRDSFNATPGSLAFLFLNRSCFNGVIRFNRSGKFNVPFCRKPLRFSRAYITKIVNQVMRCSALLEKGDWEFRVSDYRETLRGALENDFVYADPPYAGRHADYFNSWFEADENDLFVYLKRLSCPFILSTWRKNRFRSNPQVERYLEESRCFLTTFDHFYHVGAKESQRHLMTEVMITNFKCSVVMDPSASDELKVNDLAKQKPISIIS